MSVLRGAALMLCFCLAACAEDFLRQSSEEPETATTAAEETVTSEADVPSPAPVLKHLTGRKLALKPQPTRPLNVRSRCHARDAIGTQTRMDLLVKEAEVKNFKAEVKIAGRGTCRFDIKDFDQAARLPNVLLTRKADSACTVRMWEQGPQVTIAFNSCPAACDGDAFSYLWPILVDAKSGRCI